MRQFNFDLNSKVLVFNCDVPQLLENRLFNPSEAVKVSHTILPLCYLSEKALERGITCVTSDVYLGLIQKPKQALLVSQLFTQDAKAVIAAGAKAAVLTCGESPFVATRFYADLYRISGLFAHSMVFTGMEKWLNSSTKFLPMYFPQPYRTVRSAVPFSEKKLLVMASSAKGIRNWKKNVLLKLMYGLKVREINDERRKAATVFAQKGGFDLFGFGWEKDARMDQTMVARCYRGPLPYDQKAEVFSHYKFSLCFENSVFPGYVTEKIFDSMAAGCVPVYLGAPDIEGLVPKGTFIDMREFADYHELHDYLSAMRAEEHESYITRIQEFFASELYKKFTQESYAEHILSIAEQEF